MRWINRGPEPVGVVAYRRTFTPGWVRHSKTPGSTQPRDAYWSRFRAQLAAGFNEKCGYCERKCAAASQSGSRAQTVDHFKPKSRFGSLTYEWSNWVLCCSRCNGKKGNQWPVTGLVDPCSRPKHEHPEQYFDYRHSTGEIIPKAGISKPDRDKARNTISALKLNNSDIRRSRRRWIDRLTTLLRGLPPSEWASVISAYVNEAEEYCGITRMFSPIIGGNFATPTLG